MYYKTVFKKRWTDKWPKTVVFGGIHWNELGGIEGIQNITWLDICVWTVSGILCNLPAIKSKSRSINRNINRLFWRRHKFHTQSTYEFPLVERLEWILQKNDFLLDIHNSNTKNSPLFIITEHLEIGKYFDVQYVCSGFDTIEPGGSDGFMNTCLGKIGVGIECGYLTDTPKTWLKEQIRNFLKYTGNIRQTPKTYKKQKYCHATLCYKPKHCFRHARAFDDFEALQA